MVSRRSIPATVTITVTYDSLCALTRNLVTKDDVEQGSLQDTLAAAEKAAAKGQDEGPRQEARGRTATSSTTQTGKAVSAAAAAQLKSLSRYL